ncbi:hypothetical protein RMATCC62417_17296 [Rhizopus microsporus]|nr:hypothetical protein RMATCC62417_17296 [Rhizopus microsporus]
MDNTYILKLLSSTTTTATATATATTTTATATATATSTTATKKAANKIINHTLFDEIVFKEEEEEENIEVRIFGNLNQLYNQIRLIYEAEFRRVAYDTINDYGYATNHPLKFIRLSYRLLQAASLLPDAPIKLWSLLPQATHSMVYVPLSGIPTLYSLPKGTSKRPSGSEIYDF